MYELNTLLFFSKFQLNEIIRCLGNINESERNTIIDDFLLYVHEATNTKNLFIYDVSHCINF